MVARLRHGRPITGEEIVAADRRLVAQRLTRSQVAPTSSAFAARNATLADSALHENVQIARASRELLGRVASARRDCIPRESAWLVLTAARCLERIGDNAAEVGEQALLLTGEVFQELAGSLA